MLVHNRPHLTTTFVRMNALFVYGTLMQGFKNGFATHLATHATYVGVGTARGYLYDLGAYPGAIFAEKAPALIKGEVWELADFERIINQLDAYEDIYAATPEYRRKLITVQLEARALTCWAYEFCQSVADKSLIVSGDYREHTETF
jgi:gamma-glutamylcyclotransferase (GGCT)/AIG2-like uncharacterized protein YtfP